MKPVITLTILSLAVFPPAVLAQEVRRTLPEGVRAAVAPDADAAGLQAARPIVPERPPIRRRGSMVGYVDDAVIASKLRVRFETGLQNRVPDRAEFFYAKCGCYRDLLGDPAFDPESPGPRPGAANDLDFQQVFVQGEFAAGNRLSLFAEVPLRWIQPQSFIAGTGGPFPDRGGLGDIRAGLKLGLAETDAQAVTLQLRGFLPTGKAENGLGTNHATLEPALLMYHRASDRVSVESMVGVWYPLSGSDGVPITSDEKFSGSVFFYGIGPSVEVFRRRTFSLAPVVELVGWRVLDGMQTAAIGDATGINIVNLKFGARLSWDGAGSIYGGWGRALTDQDWYHDIVRFEFRQTF